MLNETVLVLVRGAGGSRGRFTLQSVLKKSRLRYYYTMGKVDHMVLRKSHALSGTPAV